MTDEQIGLEINAPQSTVCRLRNGRHKNTSYARGLAIKNLAVREGVLLSDIFGEPKPHTHHREPEQAPENSQPARPDNAGQRVEDAA